MVFSRFIGTVLLLSAWPSAWAQDPDLSDAELEKQIAEMEKEIEGELLQEYSVWDFTTNLRLGGGYKENVTMSAFADESSGFAATGFDVIGMRLPMSDTGVEATIFGAFDDRRYFDAPSVDVEQTGLINASLEKSLGESWILKSDLRLIYIDEMFDASLTEDDIGADALTFMGWTEITVAGIPARNKARLRALGPSVCAEALAAARGCARRTSAPRVSPPSPRRAAARSQFRCAP